MVLNHAICAVNVASAVLTHGICCFYEMKKEDDRNRESMMRQSVNSEWERDRFVDMITQQKERDSLKLQEDRRRKLMATKRFYDPATLSARNNLVQKTNPRGPPQDQTHDQSNQRLGPSGVFIRTCFTRQSHRPNLQVVTGPTDSYDCPLRNLSSLLDDCETEASEDEDDFEDICLE